MTAETLHGTHEVHTAPTMRAKRITAHLWRMARWGVANSYLVREDDGFTLVDTMFKGSGAAILAAAAEVGPIARVVVTHAHWDHAGSLDELGVESVLTGEDEVVWLSGERTDIRHGAEQVGRRRDGDESGARTDQRPDVVDRQLSRSVVERRPTHGRARVVGRNHPGSDVAVVIEPGHHHLVAWRPRLRERPAHLERERRHAPAEDHTARHRAEEISHCLACPGHRVFGVLLSRCHRAAIGNGRTECARDGIGDRRRGL